MPISEMQGKNVPVKLWTPLHEVESGALSQLKNIASLPNVFHHVAAMPDVHFGKGATVGSVIAQKGSVTPAAVGVDIGCGMGAMKLNLKAKDLPDSLKEIRNAFEIAVPVGNGPDGGHEDTPKATKSFKAFFETFKDLRAPVQDNEKKAIMQCGTLGGGNHFIELCLDENQDVWLMLHSGSRNIGKVLAEYHMGIAKKLKHNQDIADRDLSFFLQKTPEFDAYLNDLMWAQEYASTNRKVMTMLLMESLRKFFPQLALDGEYILCHHNYVSQEIHYGEEVLVTRKGAIKASKGMMGIIPGSMGTRSYIVEGKGNPESFESAPHGAGRRMSRGEAKRRFTETDITMQLEGVECRRDSGIMDELPGAYKDIDKVIENAGDLVEVKHILKQVLCVKG